MSDFDLSSLKATATKAADVPKIRKPRNLAVNPLAAHFDKSFSKINAETGEGPWFSIEVPVLGSFEKSPYGEVAKDALVKLQQAAGNVGSGIEKRPVPSEDGKTVTIHYRAMPKRIVNRKPKTETVE